MILYQVNARHVARNVPNTRSSEHTDVCMSLAAQTAEHERVVPTTQSRMTPDGQEQQANVTMRFAKLRALVTRQLDAVRLNDMEVKALVGWGRSCWTSLRTATLI